MENTEEPDAFLNTYDLLKLNQEDVNKPIHNNDIKAVIKSHHKAEFRTGQVQSKFTRHLRNS